MLALLQVSRLHISSMETPCCHSNTVLPKPLAAAQQHSCVDLYTAVAVVHPQVAASSSLGQRMAAPAVHFVAYTLLNYIVHKGTHAAADHLLVRCFVHESEAMAAQQHACAVVCRLHRLHS